jgi:hypothetical protein
MLGFMIFILHLSPVFVNTDKDIRNKIKRYLFNIEKTEKRLLFAFACAKINKLSQRTAKICACSSAG